MKKTILALLLAAAALKTRAQVFTLVDSVKLADAQIWGVVSDDGDSLCITTTFNPGTKPHIFMRKASYSNIAQQSTKVQLTFDSDFSGIANLTDHKSIVLNNELYCAFSTQGDQDIYLFKTDLNGNRIGNIVTVLQGSPDPTNDIILVTDSVYIYVLHFDPPVQHHIYTFDTNLNPVGTTFSTTTLPHNNIGNAIFRQNEFLMFTGSIFGFNSNLTLTKWNNTWGAAMTTPQNVLSASGGDGNWFSTGVVFDEQNQRWYIGMNHINAGQSIGQEHIDLAAFDANFNLLERKHITSTNFTRPHFVLHSGYLYVSYDQPGMGVYLHKYLVENTAGISDAAKENTLHVFPNPAQEKLFLPEEIISAQLNGISGKIISAEIRKENGRSFIDVSTLDGGMYFLSAGSRDGYRHARFFKPD